MSADKARRAAELYAEGHTWKEIAAELGVRSQAGVRQLVERYVEKLPRLAASTVREVMLERLTRAHETALKLLSDKDKSIRLRAADVVARVAERISKLHGLESMAVQHAMSPAPPPSGEVSTDHLSVAELSLVRVVVMRLHNRASPDELLASVRTFEAARIAAIPAIALLPQHASPPSPGAFGPAVIESTADADDDREPPIVLG